MKKKYHAQDKKFQKKNLQQLAMGHAKQVIGHAKSQPDRGSPPNDFILF